MTFHLNDVVPLKEIPNPETKIEGPNEPQPEEQLPNEQQPDESEPEEQQPNEQQPDELELEEQQPEERLPEEAEATPSTSQNFPETTQNAGEE